MYGFQLYRGDMLVYNLTGASVGHPFHAEGPPKWAEGIDGEDIDTVIAKLAVKDPATRDLVEACKLEQARFRRSRSKLGGEECLVRLVVTTK